MGSQFYYGFKEGLGPWVSRETGRDIPSSKDCAVVKDGVLQLRIKKNPLRTGHVYVPPDVFQVTEGYVETRMRFEGPEGAHGSVWLQALEPYLTNQDHEIDVVENFGNPKVAHHGIWTQDDTDPDPDQVVHGTWRGNLNEWNVFGVEMSSAGYRFTINDTHITTTSAYASTKPKYLIASLLVSDWELPKLQADQVSQYKTFIDWVRVSDL